MAASLAGAGMVLLFNGLFVNGGRTITSEAATRASLSASTHRGVTTSSLAVGVDPGVVSMIMSRMPGIVAVDADGPAGSVQGSGLVLQANGVILTAAQLVSGATTITVTSFDGQEWNANLLGTDSVTGAAVIGVPATGLQVIPVDSIDPPRPGGLSVVVSADLRPGGHFAASIGLFFEAHQRVDLGDGSPMTDAIVTDGLPARPLGAVLLDDRGAVIGLLRAVVSDNGVSRAVATPVALIRAAAISILHNQEVIRPWLGVSGTTAPALRGHRGVLVSSVAPGGPAALAGLRPGDVLSAIDNQAVTSMAALTHLVQALRPGSSVVLSVQRAGARLSLSASLQGQPGAEP